MVPQDLGDAAPGGENAGRQFGPGGGVDLLAQSQLEQVVAEINQTQDLEALGPESLLAIDAEACVIDPLGVRIVGAVARRNGLVVFNFALRRHGVLGGWTVF